MNPAIQEPRWRALRRLATGRRFEGVRGLAEHLHHLFPHAAPPVRVDIIAHEHGVVFGAIERHAADPWVLAYTSGNDKKRVHIRLSPELPDDAKRYWLAHGLHHLLADDDVCFSCSANEASRAGSLHSTQQIRTEEAYAHQFATELLLPAVMFEQYLTYLGHDLELTAQAFGVPVELVNDRVFELFG